MKNLIGWFYWGLPAVYLCFALSKVNFGFDGDGNILVWRLGVLMAVVAASLMCKHILDSSPKGSKKQYGKAYVALIAMPLIVQVLGFAIGFNTPGVGSNL